MTIEIIPFENPNDDYEWSQVTPLDNIEFRLTFSYNSRDEHWYLTIRTEADEEIVGCESMKLVQGGWPIRRVYDPNRPPGEIHVLSDLLSEPGFDDLGNTSIIMYVPEADMANYV